MLPKTNNCTSCTVLEIQSRALGKALDDQIAEVKRLTHELARARNRIQMHEAATALEMRISDGTIERVKEVES